jgi:gliding motility-associated-like protein
MDKMKRTFVILFLILNSLNLFSQKEANIWHFGNGFSLNFNSGQAVQESGSAMLTIEGSTSYCDSAGNLLFYSNGGGRLPSSGQSTGRIWNRNNEVMYDMQGLEGGGFSAAQSSVIVPAPGETKMYYLFTMEETEFNIDTVLASEPNGRGFRYFKIDMTLNGGLGGVVEADVPVYDNSSEGLCAIRHVNETDYWILMNYDTTGIGVYRLTQEGLSLSAVYPYPNPAGIIKATPNRLDLFPCCNRVRTYAGLFDFDISTGVLSNQTDLSIIGETAFEFSPNGQYLYSASIDFASSIPQIVRYDLVEAYVSGVSVESTKEVIDSNADVAYYMQLAPDGKIYFTQFNPATLTTSLGTIDCVNDVNPSVTLNAFSFGSGLDDVFFTLPNYPSWLFYNPYDDFIEFGPDTIYLCPGDSFLLDAGVGDYWEWGGDCFSGPQNTWPTNSSRYFTITQPGTYVACVNGPCSSGFGAGGCQSSDQITVLPCALLEDPCVGFDLGDTLTVCGTDTVQLQADLSSFVNVTGLQWTGGAGTFIPSNTIAAPRYVPTAAERTQGFVNLSLQVNATSSAAGQGGKLIAYDHLSEDLIFYISPLDGSIDTIQDNAGDDWIAAGFESSTSTFYGISAFLGLGSINIQSGVETPITFGYQENIFAGEFDNTNGIFYAVGVLPSPVGDPANQQLYSVNTNTGALTVIGNLNLFTTSSLYYGIGDGINGLAFDPQANVLYGISYNGNLYRINVSDASTSLMGPSQSDCRGLAYDASTQKLWAIDSDATLYEIDKNTGSILSTVPCQENFDFITSLTYAPPANDVQEFTCTDNVYVLLSPDNFLNLGNDTLLCNTPQFSLSQPGLSNYLWQDGSVGASFNAASSGLYALQASSLAGCVDTDTINIQFVNSSITATATSSSILLGDTVQLSATGGQNYTWSPDEGLSCGSCDSPFASPSETTTYIVTSIDSFGCRVSDTLIVEVDIRCNEVVVPTIFSPNGTGPQANETYCIFSDCVEQFKLLIFNRWGEKIFESEDISQCWDGTYKGSEAATGPYAFNLYIKKADETIVSKSGTITLVR